ncbi:MAG: 5-formyltetrahydrofolate cyclo-ligase [Alphaproteobacteria bacterium]
MKESLRQSARQTRQDFVKAHDEDYLADLHERISDHILADITLPPKSWVSGYWPIGSEADPRPAMYNLFADNHNLCLPYARKENAVMTFHHWVPGHDLIRDEVGTPSSGLDAPEIHPGVMIVPLLAFDEKGHRIGYGRGHYDRAIAEARSSRDIITIGVGYEAQKLEIIPAEETDQALDWIVTETKAYRITDK